MSNQVYVCEEYKGDGIWEVVKVMYDGYDAVKWEEEDEANRIVSRVEIL